MAIEPPRKITETQIIRREEEADSRQKKKTKSPEDRKKKEKEPERAGKVDIKI